MAHRCRTCGDPHYASRAAISFPTPDKLARIEPLTPELLEAAREFESFGEGSPLDFVEWLILECHSMRTSAFAMAGR